MLSSSLCVGIIVQKANHSGPDCECMMWSDVYGEGGLDCKPGIGGLAGDEFCTFMQKFQANVCVESQFMFKFGLAPSICYVSGECAGKGVSGPVKKYCKSGQDTLLTEMS